MKKTKKQLSVPEFLGEINPLENQKITIILRDDCFNTMLKNKKISNSIKDADITLLGKLKDVPKCKFRGYYCDENNNHIYFHTPIINITMERTKLPKNYHDRIPIFTSTTNKYVTKESCVTCDNWANAGDALISMSSCKVNIGCFWYDFHCDKYTKVKLSTLKKYQTKES